MQSLYRSIACQLLLIVPCLVMCIVLTSAFCSSSGIETENIVRAVFCKGFILLVCVLGSVEKLLLTMAESVDPDCSNSRDVQSPSGNVFF